jgi:hypothetical protein
MRAFDRSKESRTTVAVAELRAKLPVTSHAALRPPPAPP